VDVVIPPAAADCELIRPEWWGQPVNTATTAAFLVAGLVVLIRSGNIRVSTALALTGLGSFLFHGPMPPGSEWAHDVSLAWLIVVVGTSGTRFEKFGGWPSFVGLAATFAVVPVLADPAAVVLSIAGLVLLLRNPTPAIWWGIGLLTVGGIIGRLSATGGPWCRPESWLQGHGLWHLAAATSVVVIFLRRAERSSKTTLPAS